MHAVHGVFSRVMMFFSRCVIFLTILYEHNRISFHHVPFFL